MAISRYGVVVIAGLLLSVPRVLSAQQPQTDAPQSSTYDQMAAAEKQAQAAKDEAAAKQAKKGKHADEAATAPAAATAVPSATPAAAPAAEPVAASAAETPAATPAADATSAAIAAPVDGAVVAAGDVPPVAGKDPTVDPLKAVVYDKHGKVKVKKEKPPKLIPVNIVHGELTVDGLIAKARLNFQVLDLKYLYIWVPGLGTAIASNQFFSGSKLQVDAIDGSTLTIKVDGHQLQLACDHAMLSGKKPKPMSLYVALDKNYQKDSIYPEFGYGDLSKAPYSWPGTLADLNPNPKLPPLPENLKQKEEVIKICPKNADGSQGACHETEVPLVLPKKS